RLPSDGNDERVLRILVEIGIDVHAEVVPRGRSKTVEGASRTASSCDFFAGRQIVYSKDPSIDTWSKQADSVATIIKGEGAAAQLATPYDYFTAVPSWRMGPFEGAHGGDVVELAESGKLYVACLPHGGTMKLDLRQTAGEYSACSFNPRDGKHVDAFPVA